MIKIEPTIYFSSEVIKKAAKTTLKKGIREATSYLFKAIRHSIRQRTAGRKKKYNLTIETGGKRIAGKQGKHVIGNFTVHNAKTFLSRPERAKERIVETAHKRHKSERNPKTENFYIQKTTSKPGMPPLSHKTVKKGWFDYWLKKGIRADFKGGMVYLNPATKPNAKIRLAKSMPHILETGGIADSYIRYLRGYYYYPTFFKNGEKHVSYTKMYDEKLKRYHFKPRPFMKTALKKSEKKIVEILQRNLIK